MKRKNKIRSTVDDLDNGALMDNAWTLGQE